MWVIPPKQDAAFVCQMEAVLDVYKRPYHPQYPVVCLDESPKQLVSEVKQAIKKSDGSTQYDYEYKREGAAEVYMCFEPLAGRRHITVTETHTMVQWAKIIEDLATNKYPDAKKITLVQDNLSSHKPFALYKIYEPEKARRILDRIEFIYTPKHGSWLNMAEIEIGVLKRQGLKKRIASKADLVDQVQKFEAQRNRQFKKVNWQFTTEDARIKLKRLYPIIEENNLLLDTV